MAGIKCFAWNCGGLRRSTASTTSKVIFFVKTFKNDFDLFFFLEIHHKDGNDIPNELLRFRDTHHILHSETGTHDTHTGIIGLIRNEYVISDIEHIIQGRILGLKLTDTSTRTTYRISVVYLPTNQNLDVEGVQDIVRKLRLHDHNDTTSYMLSGDFNFINYEEI